VSTHLTPERAIELLEAQVLELSELRNAHARDPRFKQWRQTTLTVVQRIWPGEVARAERFRRVPFSPPSNRMSAKATRTFYEKGCAEAQHLLREMTAELEGSKTLALPQRQDPSLDPGAAEDDFPLVDLDKNAKQGADEQGPQIPTIDLPRAERPTRPAPTARPASESRPAARTSQPPPKPASPARPAAQARPAAPPPPAAEPARPAARETKSPATPPVVVRATPLPPPAPPAGEDRTAKPPLSEMLGFSATPVDDEDPFERADNAPARPVRQRWNPADAFAKGDAPEDEAPYEALEPMEPESESYEIEYDEPSVDEEAYVEPELEVEPEPEPEPESEGNRAEMEAFLSSSPVLKANAKPVVRQRPASESTPLQSPTANAFAALAAQVERFGVPEGHRAAVRAMLIDLARALDRRDADWTTLSESMRLSLAYPSLARRVIPLLVPFLDQAA